MFIVIKFNNFKNIENHQKKKILSVKIWKYIYLTLWITGHQMTMLM